jgi:asparagine synthase (glutamine-hydrolysing)
MCGFAGVLGPLRDRGVRVRAMLEAIRHRGPDGRGFWGDAHCELAHARLSIIDLSPAGAQPMGNEDGAIQVAFNGEIYNFQELRRSLEERGHTFRSRTDTEVIVHLYEELGERCVDELNGMFAFALWDSRRQQLLLARDRFGQKPLFYARLGDAWIFASEIKALLANPDLPADIDDDAVDSVLAAQFVPSPGSFYRSIRRLEAATVLTLGLHGEPRSRRFWAPHPRREELPFEVALEQVDHLFGQAVRRQRVADVPLGVFLSGGIDSSLVLAKLAEHGGPRLQAFCLGFGHAGYDEVPHARAAAARFGADLHEIEMRVEDFARPERVVEMFDEPFVDVAALPTEALCRVARPSITVALTGDGGDELFGGYEHHVMAYWLARTDRLGSARSRLSAAAASMVPTETRFRSPLKTVRKALQVLGHPNWRSGFSALRTTLSVEQRTALYTPEFLSAVETHDPWEALLPAWRGGDAIERVFDVAGDRVLSDLFLHKTDVASMSVGLECRSPFLDVPLADFVARLPLRHLVRGLRGKHLLRVLLERSAGPALARRRKQGFSPPLDEWLRRRLTDEVRELLRPGALIHRYVRQRAVERIHQEHTEKRADHKRLLWTLLMLEAFLDKVRRRRANPAIGAMASVGVSS